MGSTYPTLPSGADAAPPDPPRSSSTLSDLEWQQLLKRIEDGRCTPFLGAGVDQGVLPLGGEVARRWAKDYGYPLPDCGDLPRVAQYLSLTGPEPVFPKEQIYELIRGVKPPDLTNPLSPLGILADLPLPIYITTNYDDFMFRALRAKKRDAKVEVCGWNQAVREKPAIMYNDPDFSSTTAAQQVQVKGFGRSRFSSSNFLVSATNPMVYHLHGHYALLESMVLTENDYLDFLVNMSRDQKLLPPPIKQALTASSLLFMGYSLADYDFRVLFRGLIHPLAQNRRLSVSIQLPQTQTSDALTYLTKYFEDLQIKVYWGRAEEFAAELSRRWAQFKTGVQAAHAP